MILGLYVGLAIVGILALVRGRMQITKSKIVVGVPARLLGLLGLTPLPLALVVGIIYVMANVDITDAPAVQRFTQEHRGTLTLIEGVCVGGVAIILFTLAAVLAVPPAEVRGRDRRRARVEYDDEYDDLPPRRRRRERDEEDDRPRRRRDEDDELDEDQDGRPRRRHRDEDDRPRRRRDDLDDLDDRAR